MPVGEACGWRGHRGNAFDRRIGPGRRHNRHRSVPACAGGRSGHCGRERTQRLIEAVESFRDFLPGHYEDWVLAERRQLEESYFGAVNSLVATLTQMGDLARAAEYLQAGI